MKQILIFSFFVVLISCKNKENKSTSVPTAIENPKMEEIKAAPPTMAKIDDAFSQLSLSQKENHEITDKIWHYTFALSIKDKAPKDNIYEGQWLDLMPKGEYKKGKLQETTESGKYVYDEKTTFLEMRSTSNTSSEWKVRVDPKTMILIGTSKYGNNPWQIKLTRSDNLPEK